MYKESAYLHDDRWDVEYFVIYKSGTQRRLCSAFLVAKRNDSIFVRGNYIVYNNKIEFIEPWYYNKEANATDSTKNTFYSDKVGNLILKESIMF